MSKPSDQETDHPKHPTGDTSILGGLLSFKTPGVKNIEAAYSRAGATSNHTPGAGRTMGSQSQQGASEHQGVGSTEFYESISDQRPEVCIAIG